MKATTFSEWDPKCEPFCSYPDTGSLTLCPCNETDLRCERCVNLRRVNRPAPSPQGPAPTVAGECAHCDNTELSGSCGCCGQPCCNRCSASLRAAPTPRRPAREIGEEVNAKFSAWHIKIYDEPPVASIVGAVASAIERDRLAPVQGDARPTSDEAKLLREVADAVQCAHKHMCGLGPMCRPNLWADRLRIIADRAATQPPAPPVGTGGTKP